jgi:hypothetical protein
MTHTSPFRPSPKEVTRDSEKLMRPVSARSPPGRGPAGSDQTRPLQ